MSRYLLDAYLLLAYSDDKGICASLVSVCFQLHEHCINDQSFLEETELLIVHSKKIYEHSACLIFVL